MGTSRRKRENAESKDKMSVAVKFVEKLHEGRKLGRERGIGTPW
jgi:hypothetical protein